MIPKFRAWDSYENEMRYDIGVIEFNADDKNVSALAFNYHLDDTGYGEIDNSQSEYYDGLCFELMQSTGLKDKNGKEIYEGDIVLIELIGSELEYDYVRSCLGHVIYDDGVFDVKHNGVSTGIIPELYLSGHNYQIKLLGNIFQHPNLLEADSHE